MLGEAYRGKVVLLTGGTGFLGTALVEKMLRSLPSLGRLYLLVRPSRDKGARERFETDVLGSAAFSRLREELGAAFDERVAEKVRVLEGDVHSDSLGLGPEDLAELSREVDAVVHSAASVVFDAPLDAAVDSNVRGTLGLLALARTWEKKPLFVHVSTSYVAGTKKGLIPEEAPDGYSPNGTPLDPKGEVAHLDGVVREVEEASRERELLKRFDTEARRELGMVGEEDEVRERVEQLRRAWMRERLVERGNERARALGWQDVYTFTKSLAERRVLEERGDAASRHLQAGDHREQHRGAAPRLDPGLAHGGSHNHGLRQGHPPGVPRRPGEPGGHRPRRSRSEHPDRRGRPGTHRPSRRAPGLPGRLRREEPHTLP